MSSSASSRFVSAVLFAAIASTALAQAPVRVFPTFSRLLNNGSLSAAAIDSIADINGDGVRDILLGMPTASRAAVLDGTNGASLIRLAGPGGSNFGETIAAIGDVDGDGLEDIAVGAPDFAGNGAVLIFGTLTGGGLYATVTQTTPNAPLPVPSRFGASITRLGDINGDGIEEIAIGAPQYTGTAPFAGTRRGLVEVIDLVLPSPPPVVPWTMIGFARGTVAWEELGGSLTRLSDLDQDGIPELAVGASRQFFGGGPTQPVPGVVRVFSGASLAAIGPATVLANLLGQANGDTFGWSIANAGDLDLDGVDDLVVGAPSLSSTPAFTSAMAYVYSGKRISTAAGGNAAYEYYIKPLGTVGPSAFGWSVSGSTDVNGDGRPDLVIGSPITSGPSTQPGYALVASGFNGSPLQVLTALTPTTRFGYCVSELGGGGAPRIVIDPVSATLHFY